MLKEFNTAEIHHFSTQSLCLQIVSLSERERGQRGQKEKQLIE